jgi:hypothetical protein
MFRYDRFTLRQRVRESNPCTSFERAYAFPRVPDAVTTLLRDSGPPRPASVAVCTVDIDAGGIKHGPAVIDDF